MTSPPVFSVLHPPSPRHCTACSQRSPSFSTLLNSREPARSILAANSRRRCRAGFSRPRPGWSDVLVAFRHSSAFCILRAGPLRFLSFVFGCCCTFVFSLRRPTPDLEPGGGGVAKRDPGKEGKLSICASGDQCTMPSFFATFSGYSSVVVLRGARVVSGYSPSYICPCGALASTPLEASSLVDVLIFFLFPPAPSRHASFSFSPCGSISYLLLCCAMRLPLLPFSFFS